MSHVKRKPVFGVFDRVRLKPACTATEVSWRFKILDIETRGIILSGQRTSKVLIRLRGCAGWSAPLLFAYGKTDFLMTWLIWYSDIHVTASKAASARFSFHFNEVCEKYIEYIRNSSFWWGRYQNFGKTWYVLEEFRELAEDEGSVTCMLWVLCQIFLFQTWKVQDSEFNQSFHEHSLFSDRQVWTGSVDPD